MVPAIVAAWAVVLVVVSPTAFRVDEPNIIAIAKQIAQHPLDPYGFTINWIGTPQPAWRVLANPPLVPAWLAAWAGVFGWSESSLHIAVIPFSAIALVAIAMLAESFAASPVVLLALAIASPAFALASQVVMPDMAMLAAVTLAIAAALRADRSRVVWMVACAAAFAAPLCKYNGVAAVAVLAVIAMQKRTLRTVAIAAAPVAAIVAWSLAGWLRYGSPHLIALRELQAGGLNPLPGIVAAFGLGVLPVVAWAGARLDRRAVLAGTFIGVASGVVAWRLLEYSPASSILYALACAATTAFLLQIRTREAVLVVWLVTPVILQFGQAFTSVRYLIAMLPPALLLWRGGSRTRVAVSAAAAAVLVALLSWGDAETANLYRGFVRAHPTARYSGHWGLQYYAELQHETPVATGEHVTESVTTAMHAFPPVVVEGRAYRMFIRSPLHTIDCAGAANFYSNAIANCEHYPVYLPFALSRSEVETFVIAERQP